MPIYEYLCGKCKRKSEIITFSVSETVALQCRHCGGSDLHRVPSRVRVRMSEETRMERLADPARLSGLDETDPKSMARWMKSMSKEMGEEMGDDFDVDQAMDEAMAEKDSMGGRGGDMSPGGFDE